MDNADRLAPVAVDRSASGGDKRVFTFRLSAGAKSFASERSVEMCAESTAANARHPENSWLDG
jgi:hypothetical protein